MRAIDKQRFGNDVLDYIIDWISCNLEVEDVFDTNDLEEWAESSGYVKEE